MRYFFAGLVFCGFTFNCYAQAPNPATPVLIRFQEPSGWFFSRDTSPITSINKKVIDSTYFLKFIDSSKKNSLVLAYYKEHLSSKPGLIPTFKIIIGMHKATNFEEFKKIVTQATEKLQRSIGSIDGCDSMNTVTLSGVPGLHYTCNYSVRLKGGIDTPLRMHRYSFARGRYIISIDFMDDAGENDTANFFEALLMAIEL